MTASRFSAESPILVAGTTGFIGREVVRALLERGAPVRVFGRALDASLPVHIERVVGTLEDRAATRRAVRGVRAAFFVPPHDVAEETLAENFVHACEHEGGGLVFAGVHCGGPDQLARLLHREVCGWRYPYRRGPGRGGDP